MQFLHLQQSYACLLENIIAWGRGSSLFLPVSRRVFFSLRVFHVADTITCEVFVRAIRPSVRGASDIGGLIRVPLVSVTQHSDV
jgi:hypothetical protein